MRGPTFTISLSLISKTVSAFTEYGLTGFPANSYAPICGTACIRSLYTMTLSCSTEGASIGMVTLSTSKECYAENSAYLESVAWCTHINCKDSRPSASLLEYWWEMQITGQKAAGLRTVPAKWTYAGALGQVRVPPTVQLMATDTVLNTTSLVPPEVWQAQYNVLYSTQRKGTVTNTYGIAMLVVGFVVPIVITLVGYLPYSAPLLVRLRPYITWRSTVGSYHIRSLPYLIGRAPTVGQACYVLLFLVLNIVFTAVNYESRQPNAWNPTVHSEIMSYLLGRTGIYAYIFMPLLFLFASRDNVLLWLTDWSHSTYLVLHRWVARIFTAQVLLHSVVALAKYVQTGMYATEVSKPYWIWGVVATLCVVILCFASGLYIRDSHYELFLLTHIILSAITVVGCWYHAYDLYGMLGGYGYWIYAVSAVWAFDRIARALRIWITGTRRSVVRELDEDAGYVRVDIPNVRWSHAPGLHAYLYFPTLSRWTPWQCHPFSVMPTVLLQSSTYRGKAESTQTTIRIVKSDSSGANGEDTQKREASSSAFDLGQHERRSVGLTFFVRKSSGFTRHLRAEHNLLTLVEGPYHNNSSSRILRCDRLLLIAGGIGITAIVPFLANHWNVKLWWSVREKARCLANELEGVLSNTEDKDVRIGRRLNIQGLIADAADAGWGSVGVVVSGPPSLCDDVRTAVVGYARRDRAVRFELEVEAYSW